MEDLGRSLFLVAVFSIYAWWVPFLGSVKIQVLRARVRLSENSGALFPGVSMNGEKIRNSLMCKPFPGEIGRFLLLLFRESQNSGHKCHKIPRPFLRTPEIQMVGVTELNNPPFSSAFCSFAAAWGTVFLGTPDIQGKREWDLTDFTTPGDWAINGEIHLLNLSSELFNSKCPKITFSTPNLYGVRLKDP